MSLDLYIKTSTPVIKRGTGVYVREDGKTKELKTMAEVKERFPDADLSQIKVFEHETDEVWHENITHNMNKMAEGEIPKKFGIFHKLYEDCRLTKLSTMEKQEYEKSVLEYEDVKDAMDYHHRLGIEEGFQKGLEEGRAERVITSQKKPRAKHSWLFYWLISGKTPTIQL